MKVLDAHHRKSPLIQEGLEIPVEVIMEMADTEENRLALAKYEAMTAERYTEPVDGKYQDATAAILAGLGSELEADVELSGGSSKSEAELGQENAKREGSDTESGSDEEGIDASDVSDGEYKHSSDEAGTDALGEEGTDASNGEGLDSLAGEDLLKIDVSRGNYWETGIHVTVLTLAVIFICEDNFLRGQFLAILALLAKFAKINTC